MGGLKPPTPPICREQITNRGECGELLRVVVTHSGVKRLGCLRCTWRAAGLCWQCGAERQNGPLGVLCLDCKRTNDKASMVRRLTKARAQRILRTDKGTKPCE